MLHAGAKIGTDVKVGKAGVLSSPQAGLNGKGRREGCPVLVFHVRMVVEVGWAAAVETL